MSAPKLYLWASLGLLAAAQAGAAVSGTTSLSSEQFATETAPGGRLGADIQWLYVDGPDDYSKIEFHGFFESGSRGDYSFDLDPVQFKFPWEQGYYWLGRSNPADEGRLFGRISRTSAIGANWVQNQSDALDSRVSGWVSTGLRQNIPGTRWFGTAAFSPIFIPTFGPALNFSEVSETTGSRYSRMPPQYVRVNDSLVPLRYQIDRGDLSNILLQTQFYASVDYQSELQRFSFFGWSAPAPNPEVDTVGTLRARNDGVTALVVAKPRFPRENFVGASAELKSVVTQPEVQIVHEIFNQHTTGSVTLRPTSNVSLGVLHTLNQKIASVDSSGDYPSPSYAGGLVWAEASAKPFRKWTASLRLETHLLDSNRGSWIKPRMEFLSSNRVKLFAAAQLIAGQDYSYFGNWRSLDAVSMGLVWIW